MTHKEQRIRRRNRILQIHGLEEKYKKYINKFWYYFSSGFKNSQWNSEILMEDQQVLLYFKQFKTQKERAALWRNKDFVNAFCNRVF